MTPRIGFYGDDFTGATDTLAVATRAGLRTLLFLRVPTRAELDAAGPLDCVGIAGIDFVKDDEVCANPVHAPIADRVREVMARVRRYRDRRGRLVMVAFNITDDLDAMRRHAELVER